MLVNLYRHWDPSIDKRSDRTIQNITGLNDNIDWIEDCYRVLDLGCGVGRLVAKLNKGNHSAVGITYNEDELGVEECVMQGDMHNLEDFNDDSFDAIIIWDSLEHCISPLIALFEAARVTKPGGRGLIFMPGITWQGCGYHILCLTIKQMEHLLELSGWTVEEVVDMSDKDPDMAVYKIAKVQ